MAEFSVRGQIAVITGAADGIGKAIAIKLAFEGCNLALVDIQETKLNNVAMHLQSLFPSIKVHAFKCDVTDINSMKSLVQNIKASFNTKCVQLLFNNVGIFNTEPTLYSKIDKLKKELNINLWSAVYATRLFLPMLLANNPEQQSYIVNTGSIASIQTGFSWYSVTKHALIAYGETVREELKRIHPKSNILVSTLVPAFVNTNIRANSAVQLDEKDKWEETRRKWNKSNRGIMVKQSEIDVNDVANIVYNGLKNKKVVIPTHLSWHKAAIEDRMNALLNCTKDNKSNMRKAVRATIKRRQTSKL